MKFFNRFGQKTSEWRSGCIWIISVPIKTHYISGYPLTRYVRLGNFVTKRHQLIWFSFFSDYLASTTRSSLLNDQTPREDHWKTSSSYARPSAGGRYHSDMVLSSLKEPSLWIKLTMTERKVGLVWGQPRSVALWQARRQSLCNVYPVCLIVSCWDVVVFLGTLGVPLCFTGPCDTC